VSWGNGCGDHPTVYTKVSAYYDWIVEKTTHTVKTDCEACSTDVDWRDMCESIGGTYKRTSASYRCSDLDVMKTRNIDYSWNDCSNSLVKDLCKQIGVYSCDNNAAQCTPL